MMVLKSFSLVLKKYGKWLLKMCGNPVFISQPGPPLSRCGCIGPRAMVLGQVISFLPDTPCTGEISKNGL